MAVERRPLERLEREKIYESNRLKAFGQLNSRLASLREAVSAMSLTSSVRTTKASVSSEAAFTATSQGAIPGSYSISVSQLAQVQKSVTTGYSSRTEGLFGSGTITINDQVIAIDAANNSLQGIMAAINAVTGETGVSATLINDGSASPHRLVLSGQDAASTFTVTSNLQGGAAAFATTTTQEAQQAHLLVDGIAVVSNANTVSGVIAGITLNLTALSPVASPGPPPVYSATQLSVAPDTEALKEKITAFVSSYNQVMSWIAAGYRDPSDPVEQTSDDGGTKPAEDDLSSYLRGDATVNGLKRGLQRILTSFTEGEGSLRILAEIGITSNRDGTLTLNAGKLDAAMEEDFEAVGTLLAGDANRQGVMREFNSYLLRVTSASAGMYAEKRSRYDSRVRQLDTAIDHKTALLEKKEAYLRARFESMELLLSSLNAQGSYLAQQMEMLANMNTGGKRR